MRRAQWRKPLRHGESTKVQCTAHPMNQPIISSTVIDISCTSRRPLPNAFHFGAIKATIFAAVVTHDAALGRIKMSIRRCVHLNAGSAIALAAFGLVQCQRSTALRSLSAPPARLCRPGRANLQTFVEVLRAVERTHYLFMLFPVPRPTTPAPTLLEKPRGARLSSRFKS
jgi:hypothetical protein